MDTCRRSFIHLHSRYQQASNEMRSEQRTKAAADTWAKVVKAREICKSTGA